MTLLLRASCLLSLLLAGFVPPGRGQEKSKVSEPPGCKTSSRRPGVHRAAEPPLPQRHRVPPPCPAAATPLCDPRSLHLSIKPRPACFSGQNEPGRTALPEFICSPLSSRRRLAPHSVSWDRLCHSVGFEEGVGSCPAPYPRRQQESAIDGHSEKLLGVERQAESLFTYPRALKAEICHRKSFGLEAHPFLGLSFSTSRVWLERRGERMTGRLWNPLVALPIHSSLVSHIANTVARKAKPGQAESSGAPTTQVQVWHPEWEWRGETEGRRRGLLISLVRSGWALQTSLLP